jgi:hypothetical protein
MRCDCCNRALSDYECSLKSVATDAYMNTCVKCLMGLQISVKGNGMLKKKLDEQEAAYDEWNEFDDYDVELQDVCIDYTLTQDDENEEG